MGGKYEHKICNIWKEVDWKEVSSFHIEFDRDD